jgi:hypothetical protein
VILVCVETDIITNIAVSLIGGIVTLVCVETSVHLHLQLFVGGLMSYLRYLWLFTYSGVQHILCCVIALFFFVLCDCSVFLCLVCPMLPVSLDCPQH